MRRALVLAVLFGACGPRAEPAPAAAPVSTPAPTPDRDPEPEPVAAPPSFTDAELDAMDDPELQAACFAGSSAACDRLGH